jgi:hypothetical protein
MLKESAKGRGDQGNRRASPEDVGMTITKDQVAGYKDRIGYRDPEQDHKEDTDKQ